MSDEDEPLYVPLKERRRREEERLREFQTKRRGGKRRKEVSESDEETETKTTSQPQKRKREEKEQHTTKSLRETKRSLLDIAAEKQLTNASNPRYELEKKIKEEERMMEKATTIQAPALISVAERAKGITYTESIKTSWRPPRHIREMTQEKFDKMRQKCIS